MRCAGFGGLSPIFGYTFESALSKSVNEHGLCYVPVKRAIQCRLGRALTEEERRMTQNAIRLINDGTHSCIAAEQACQELC